jgi:hypothetical protein
MAIQSPCVDICRIDGKSAFCVGCLRTREEIREWKGMTDHRRHQVIHDRARRAAKLAPHRNFNADGRDANVIRQTS